jgi:uncharacterized membrane protein
VGKGRLEAFSDGVIAIIITIMVLELKMPHGATLTALRPLVPVFASYVVSFSYVAIYWNNHHHLLQLVHKVNGTVLWANLHLLFWLSLVPVVTSWGGDAPGASTPAALYGVALLMAGLAWLLLQRTIIALHGHDSELQHAIGGDLKGKVSAIAYASAVGLAFVSPYISYAIYVAVAVMWFVPDPRVERELARTGGTGGASSE